MKRKSSVKVKLLASSIIPTLLIGIVVAFVGMLFMKNGMEEEILKGLLSSAYTYKDIGVNITDREPGDNTTEENLKSETGYDFTWFDGDTRKNSSLGASVIGTQAADTVIKAVIQGGETFTSKNTQVAGQAYFVAYVPIIKDGKTIAMAFTGVSRESVNAQIRKSIIVLSIIVVMLLIVVGAVCYLIANAITKAISKMNESINRLANGEFVKADAYLDRTDEIGDVLNNTNTFIDKLKEIIDHINQTTEVLERSSNQLNEVSTEVNETMSSISNAVEDIANGATDQANNIQGATEGVATIDSAITNVSDTANSLADKAMEMNESSKSSEHMLIELEKNIGIMSENIESILQAIEDTNSAVDAVNEKVAMINSIASQTNLLALNANIEAARAGDAGRGFTVVATEIGNLATNSSNTANQIKDEMSNLFEVMKIATEKAATVQTLNTTVSESLKNTVANTKGLINNIEETVEQVNAVSSNANECQSSKATIVDAMSSLSAISEENAASTEQTSASVTQLTVTVSSLANSAVELKELTEKLRADMAFFKVEE